MICDYNIYKLCLYRLWLWVGRTGNYLFDKNCFLSAADVGYLWVSQAVVVMSRV